MYNLDFKKAYYSLHKGILQKCMEEFKIPKKLINICKTGVQKTRSADRIEETLSSSFKNKQDCSRVTIPNIIRLSITKSDTNYKNGS